MKKISKTIFLYFQLLKLSNKIIVLDSMHWLNKSVNLIKPDVIKKYFIKDGLNLTLVQQTNNDTLLDNDFKLFYSEINEKLGSDY